MNRLLKGNQVRCGKPFAFVYERREKASRTRPRAELVSREVQEAGALVARAREEAERILAQAKEEAEIIRKRAEDEGYRKGHSEGYKKGLQEGEQEGAKKAREELRGLLDRARDIVREAEKEKRRLLGESESELVSLALAVARKVVARELKLDRTVVLDIVRETLSSLPQSGSVAVHVNPADVDLVREAVSSAQSSITVRADPSVAEGGCKVKSDFGTVDSTIETRLLRIKEVLEGEPV